MDVLINTPHSYHLLESVGRGSNPAQQHGMNKATFDVIPVQMPASPKRQWGRKEGARFSKRYVGAKSLRTKPKNP